jgi:hypothetical protein
MADTAIVILTGQSQNAWRGSTRFLETGWSGARQFVGGGAALEMDFAAINLTETPDHNDTASVVTQAETTGGQSPIAGIASALSGAGFTRVYLYSAAIGSRAYDAQFGSGIFQSVVTGVQRMIELAAGQGDTDPDIFFYHAHGERDAVNGRTAEQYRDDSILWIQRLQLLAAQYLERPAYRAPVFFSMPIQNKNPTGGSDASNDIAIKHGIKLAADSADVSEVYILPTYSTVILSESDLIHPDEASFVRRGEYVGFLIKDYLAGTVYEPLRITSVTRSGATVTVQFTHDIVRDATENWGGNLNGVDGFEYFDNGSEIAISGVVYSGDTATITLNSTPAGSDAQQVLRLGMQVTATSAAPNQANICGTVIRKTGAGVASVTNVGVTHHDFAIHEEISGFPYDYTPPSPGGILGTLSATESSDSSTFDGSIAIDGVLSATELVDTASFTAGFDVDGVLSAIELEDAATFTASVVTNVIGTLSATEPADVADMSGAIELLGVLTAVESADVALFGGTIVTGLAGTLSAVELEDTAVLSASVDVLGMMSVNELGDTAVLTATFQSALAGTLSAVEASDVASFTGAIDVAGVLAVTEAADVASLPATVELTGNELLESINDKVCELWQLAGLEAGNPMTVTPTTRTTQNGEIDLTLSGDGVSTKTVTRN